MSLDSHFSWGVFPPFSQLPCCIQEKGRKRQVVEVLKQNNNPRVFKRGEFFFMYSIFISPTEITQGGGCHGNFWILRGPSVSAGQRNHSNTCCRRTLIGEGCTLSVRHPTSLYVHHSVQPIKSRTRCTMFPSQPEPEPEGCALCNLWHPAVCSPKDQRSEQLSTVHHSNGYRWEISERVASLHTLIVESVCFQSFWPYVIISIYYSRLCIFRMLKNKTFKCVTGGNGDSNGVSLCLFLGHLFVELFAR